MLQFIFQLNREGGATRYDARMDVDVIPLLRTA